MKAVLATIIIIHRDKHQTFAGVFYQGLVQDAKENIIIDPQGCN